MIRVVLADDQAVVRAGFRMFLELAGDVEVVGEAASGPEVVALARAHRPDVVCMDVRMPGGNGLVATREITGLDDPVPAVLVVTTFDLDDYVFGALEAGASGFVLKDTHPDDLVDAVRRLARGDGLIDRAVTRRVIAEFARRRPAPDAAPDGGVAPLTPRETEIVRMLARGLSNAEIAEELVVETSTVKSHLGRVMAKIGTRDRLQTVVWAYRTGVAAPDPD